MQEGVQKLLSIPLDEIFSDDKFNCRGTVNPEDVMQLAKSIRQAGLIQPITVRSFEGEKYDYELVAGFRRHSAFQLLRAKASEEIIRLKELIEVQGAENLEDELEEQVKLYERCKSISAVVKEITTSEAKILNLVENIEREDLNLLQEARAIASYKWEGLHREELARLLGTSPGWVQIRYCVLELPEPIQIDIASGLLTQNQIRDIHSLDTEEEMYDIVKKIKTKKINGLHGDIVIKKRKIDKNKRTMRKKHEIFEMMETIADEVGIGFHSRCLAWASGSISTNQLLYSMEVHAKENDLEYRVMKDSIPEKVKGEIIYQDNKIYQEKNK